MEYEDEGSTEPLQVSIVPEEKDEKWSEDQKKRKNEINDEAYNLLVLSLADLVLRKVP
ncbi:unnamed protein product [Rhodiola kirilowii]